MSVVTVLHNFVDVACKEKLPLYHLRHKYSFAPAGILMTIRAVYLFGTLIKVACQHVTKEAPYAYLITVLASV